MRNRMLAATCAALTTVPAADALAASPAALDGLVAKAQPLHPFPGRPTPYPPAVTAALRLASDAVIRQRLVRANLGLARTHATLAGGHVGHPYAVRAQRWSLGRLRTENASLRRENHMLRMAAQTGPSASPTGVASSGGVASAPLQSIAQCESGGDPGAVGGGGAYRGKYQFDRQTWASIGGSGDPAAAPEGEQDRRAAALYARSGTAPWPVCGR